MVQPTCYYIIFFYLRKMQEKAFRLHSNFSVLRNRPKSSRPKRWPEEARLCHVWFGTLQPGSAAPRPFDWKTCLRFFNLDFAKPKTEQTCTVKILSQFPLLQIVYILHPQGHLPLEVGSEFKLLTVITGMCLFDFKRARACKKQRKAQGAQQRGGLITPFQAMKDLDSSSVNVFFSWVKQKSISYESLLAVSIALSQRPEVCGSRGLHFQLGAWNFRADGSLVLRSFFKPHFAHRSLCCRYHYYFHYKSNVQTDQNMQKNTIKTKNKTNISCNSHNQQSPLIFSSTNVNIYGKVYISVHMH